MSIKILHYSYFRILILLAEKNLTLVMCSQKKKDNRIAFNFSCSLLQETYRKPDCNLILLDIKITYSLSLLYSVDFYEP